MVFDFEAVNSWTFKSLSLMCACLICSTPVVINNYVGNKQCTSSVFHCLHLHLCSREISIITREGVTPFSTMKRISNIEKDISEHGYQIR